VNAAAWTASDEGYLRAYQWSGALAGGAALPQEAPPIQLGPGEVAHARFAAMGVSGFFGEDKPYRPGFLLVGGPVGLAVTGAASLARNAAKKAETERAAVPRWHRLGTADVTVTNQRLVAVGNGQTGSFWYVEMSPLQMAPGSGPIPAVEFQPGRQPLLRLESPWSPMLYVFVHRIVDGRAPGVPLPPGLLERAQQQGRLARG
jgi:hypothetical protein